VHAGFGARGFEHPAHRKTAGPERKSRPSGCEAAESDPIWDGVLTVCDCAFGVSGGDCSCLQSSGGAYREEPLYTIAVALVEVLPFLV